jgi:type VI secretion system secreted protein Hcp
MPIYMKYGELKGNVTAEGHVGWSELHSLNWGVCRAIDIPVGSAANRESTAPNVSPLVVTKSADAASTKLLEEALQGEGVAVTIDFCKTDKGKLEVYLQFTLRDCMIADHTTSSLGDRPSESLVLNFTKFQMTFTPMTATGQAGSPEVLGYDLSTAKVV